MHGWRRDTSIYLGEELCYHTTVGVDLLHFWLLQYSSSLYFVIFFYFYFFDDVIQCKCVSNNNFNACSTIYYYCLFFFSVDTIIYIALI